MNEYQRKEQRIRDLQSMLSCTSSSVGDWKIAKCVECRMLGLDEPYNLNELHEKRQAIRDEINAIQEELAVMADKDANEGM